MGYDLARFHGTVDEELLCPICSGVLENPMQAPDCEHAFCLACIREWISRQATCPVDRQAIQANQLKPVPRILRNLLARCELSCENAHHGCTAVVKLDHLSHHLKGCEHNPKRPVACAQGCGLTVPKDEMKAHNCVRELHGMLRAQEQKYSDVTQDLSDCKYQLAEQRREINLLKDRMRSLRLMPSACGVGGAGLSSVGGAGGSSGGSGDHRGAAAAGASGVSSGGQARTVTNQIQDDEVVRWSGSLTRARVTRWGGMISTPDAVLQTMIQRALGESGCPEHIINELMSNAHERRWPPGLLTLETRQMNRPQYEEYVCKRIPNKQAVVVMACDNMHMSDDMILEPGLVMIFAHGIE